MYRTEQREGIERESDMENREKREKEGAKGRNTWSDLITQTDDLEVLC